MNNSTIVAGRPYDPRNPDVLQARELKSEYIVYYSRYPYSSEWHLERVSDGTILAQGQLQAMLALLTLYPNSRRATWAEDMLRHVPYFLTKEATESDNRLFAILENIGK